MLVLFLSLSHYSQLSKGAFKSFVADRGNESFFFEFVHVSVVDTQSQEPKLTSITA